MLWEYFGQKLCTFHTIFSIIRVYMKQKCLTFSKNYTFALKNIHRKGWWGGGLGVCTVWVGAKDIYGYGKKKVAWPDGSKTVSKVHRLAFMIHFKTLNVPTVDSFGEQLDINHLCHTKLCINPLHLTFENHSTKLSRTHCRKAVWRRSSVSWTYGQSL